MGHGSLSLGPVAPMSSLASGSSCTIFVSMGLLIATKPAGSSEVSLSALGLTIMRLLA
jgi:hypothetical protein